MTLALLQSGSTVNVGGSAGHAPKNLVRAVTLVLMVVIVAMVHSHHGLDCTSIILEVVMATVVLLTIGSLMRCPRVTSLRNGHRPNSLLHACI